MSPKTLIFVCSGICSTLGGMLPELWGDSGFSTAVLLFSTAGGVIGIIIGYKISQSYS